MSITEAGGHQDIMTELSTLREKNLALSNDLTILNSKLLSLKVRPVHFPSSSILLFSTFEAVSVLMGDASRASKFDHKQTHWLPPALQMWNTNLCMLVFDAIASVGGGCEAKA